MILFYLVTFKLNVPLKKYKIDTQKIIYALILASNYIFYIIYFLIPFKLHNINFKLYIKQNYEIDHLHLIVAPSVSGGW